MYIEFLPFNRGRRAPAFQRFRKNQKLFEHSEFFLCRNQEIAARRTIAGLTFLLLFVSRHPSRRRTERS